METPEAEESPRLVKRYANRKLYDTRDSRYVTLHEIARYVRDGEDVRIIDNRTKEDLTDITLAQIIYEEQKGKKSNAWSVKTLRQLVRDGGDRLMSSLQDSPVAKLVRREDGPDGPDGSEGDGKGESEVGGLEGAEEPEAATRGRLIDKPKEAWEELSRLKDARVLALVGVAKGQLESLKAEIQRLSARVEELESTLSARQRKGQDDD
ncbi:MAG: polyhydroxyalkanoate synthesis regulator DNA-binding domain-containing protein [Deltaproteobacteria bacterium]|nr:polyhydroxyalkanoate synthesis regulator DNA-binding domain-containing protein [Deltaproteobacteria bacterium]